MRIDLWYISSGLAMLACRRIYDRLTTLNLESVVCVPIPMLAVLLLFFHNSFTLSLCTVRSVDYLPRRKGSIWLMTVLCLTIE